MYKDGIWSEDVIQTKTTGFGAVWVGATQRQLFDFSARRHHRPHRWTPSLSHRYRPHLVLAADSSVPASLTVRVELLLVGLPTAA